MSSRKLTVSQLARLAGVGPDSIRAYERIGLVPRAERSPTGYRLWSPEAVQYLKWVAPAKRAGFSLRELADIFRRCRAGSAPCHTVRDLLQRKLTDLDREMNKLATLRTELRRVRVRWNRRLRQERQPDRVRRDRCVHFRSGSSDRVAVRILGRHAGHERINSLELRPQENSLCNDAPSSPQGPREASRPRVRFDTVRSSARTFRARTDTTLNVI